MKTGGAEHLMVDLLPILRDKGNEIHLLLFDGTDTPFKEQLQNSGIRIFELGRNSNVYDIRNLFKLRKYLKSYDIIHTHNTACQYYAALAKILSGTKCKFVTTEHNTTNRRRNIVGFEYIDRSIYRRYDKIICISDKAEEMLRDYIGNNFPITTISNGIDIGKFSQAATSDIFDKNRTTIIQVAAFREQKDQPTLIRATALLSDSYHTVFVGDGVCRPQCIALAEKLGITDRITFLGNRTDIPQLLKAADIVVMSSHWEGFGLAAVEGMAAHKPVIANDVDGLKQVVDGAGILFEHGNAKDLAKKIKEIAENPMLYEQTADKCLQRAQEFDISKMAEHYHNAYKSLFNE